MKRRQIMEAALSLLAGVALTTGTRAQTPKNGTKDDIYVSCAKACAYCETVCAACNKHCAEMVKMGIGTHEKSRRLSADCRDLCAVSAKIVGRRGPQSIATCEACAKACRDCGGECGKYPDMEIMKKCAASCARCEKECLAMIGALKGKQV